MDEEPARTSFPFPLAGRIALQLSAKDFAFLNRSCRQILTWEEEQGLWLQYCRAEGFARIVSQDACLSDHTASHGPAHRTAPPCQVDWGMCFRLNAEARMATSAVNNLREMCALAGISPPPGIAGPLYASVRVNGEDVSLPAEAKEDDDSHYSEHRAWLCSRGWRSVDSLRLALRRILVGAGNGVPFRFREWLADRPGALLRRSAFNSVGNAPTGALVEWPVSRSADGAWRWSMPPHTSQEEEEGMPDEEEWNLIPSPQPWGRGNGWLVELCLETPAAGHAGDADVKTSKWVHIGPSTPSCEVTVQQLCREVAKHLGALGLTPDRPVLLASSRHPFSVAESLDPVLRLQDDIRWTQGERLILSDVPVTSIPAWACDQVSMASATPLHAVLFRRDARRPKPSPPVPNAPQTDAELIASGYRMVKGTTTPRKAGEAQKQGGLLGKDAPESSMVAHVQKLLRSSTGARQFEFHPTRPNLLLTGRVDGVVAVLDHERDVKTHGVKVDNCPILGLSWLHTQPQMAVVGASATGSVSLVRCVDGQGGHMEYYRLESFPSLSSLSMCCTDDFFATSGVSTDVGLYDTVTGKRSHTFQGLHKSSINIVRFARSSPHLFATASFDRTCKVWDLREPIAAHRPVRLLDTNSINVMCYFSPDDTKILCSGVDTTLREFSLDSRQEEPVAYRVPAAAASPSFRRSVYLADGKTIATAATGERCLRLYSAEAPNQFVGMVDFRGLLSKMCKSRGGSRRGQRHPPGQPVVKEYVQSLRGHPTDPTLLGAMLSTSDNSTAPHIAKVLLKGL